MLYKLAVYTYIHIMHVKYTNIQCIIWTHYMYYVYYRIICEMCNILVPVMYL